MGHVRQDLHICNEHADYNDNLLHTFPSMLKLLSATLAELEKPCTVQFRSSSQVDANEAV